MKKKSWKMTALSLALASALVLSACGSTPSGSASSGAASSSGASSSAAVSSSASASASASASSSQTTDATLDIGSWADKVYTNDWIGLTFTLPEGWYAMTNDQIQQALGAGNSYISNDLNLNADDLAASISATDTYAFYTINTARSGFFFLDAFDREVGKVPNMTPAEYLQQIKAMYESMDSLEVEFGDISDATLAGHTGSQVSLTMTNSATATTSKQQYIVVEQDQYLLAFVLGVNDESAQADVDALLAQLG